MTSATERLRALLTERGVEWSNGHGDCDGHAGTLWDGIGGRWYAGGMTGVCGNRLYLETPADRTPEQAVAATLGPVPWVSPTWERWHKSLRHDEVKTIGDAVEQLMYEVIKFGGDMGPNGNTYNGIDEGDVLTAGYINEWVERFENVLGPGTCRMEHLWSDDIDGVCWWCKACDKPAFTHGDFPPNYCPNCGRRVVE